MNITGLEYNLTESGHFSRSVESSYSGEIFTTTDCPTRVGFTHVPSNHSVHASHRTGVESLLLVRFFPLPTAVLHAQFAL